MCHVVSQPHEDKLMELLRAGRLDIVIGDRPWALSLLRRKENSCLVFNDPPRVVIPCFTTRTGSTPTSYPRSRAS